MICEYCGNLTFEPILDREDQDKAYCSLECQYQDTHPEIEPE